MKHLTIRQNAYQGFTLIELLVTIAVIGVVTAIAAPSFTATIQSNRLATYANDLVTAINIARSEAIKRGVQVTILRTGGTSAQWEFGWTIFVDSNADEAFNDNADTTLCEETGGIPTEDCLLKTFPALNNGYTLSTGGSSYKDYIAYAPTGLTIAAAGAGDTFRLCGSSANNNTASRDIVLNAVGRAYVSTGNACAP